MASVPHIHSSLSNDLKVPVKIAQEQLGHASISTRLNIYTHVVDASHRKAIEESRRLRVHVAARGARSAVRTLHVARGLRAGFRLDAMIFAAPRWLSSASSAI